MYFISTETVYSILLMGGLGFLFSGALGIADKLLRVESDPRVDKIYDILPGANCGACGCAGCYDFAEKVVKQEAGVNGCPMGGEETAAEIACVLGIKIDTSNDRLLPRVLCSGTSNTCKIKNGSYTGSQSCAVQDIVGGGQSLCYYGCLGGGDCVKACPFGAMIMNKNGLPEVIEDLCTGCGICAKACPRNIIEMHQADRKLFVFCKSHDDPKKSREVCSASCIGCGICARKSNGAITMENYLPVVHHDKIKLDELRLNQCPTKVIRIV